MKKLKTGHDIHYLSDNVDLCSSSVTLIFKMRVKLFRTAHHMIMVNICAKLYKIPLMDEEVIDQTLSTSITRNTSIRQCRHLISMCVLDLQDRGLFFSHDMSYDYGEHLCQVISKSLHQWLSYGPDTDGWSPFLCPTFFLFFVKELDNNEQLDTNCLHI